MIECIKFKPFNKGCLVGFADFYIEINDNEKWGFELRGCSVWSKDGSRWINLPSKEYDSSEGEKKFSPFLWLRNEEARKKSVEVLKNALDTYCAEHPPEKEVSSHQEEQFQDELPF